MSGRSSERQRRDRTNGEKITEAGTGYDYENDVNFLPAELDGAGNIVGFSDPYWQPEPTPLEAPEYVGYMPFANPGERTTYNPQEPQVILDGIAMTLSEYEHLGRGLQNGVFRIRSVGNYISDIPGLGTIVRAPRFLEGDRVSWHFFVRPVLPIDSESQLRSADEALKATRTILAIDSDCSRFFGELGLFVLSKLAAQIRSATVTRLSSDDWLGIQMDQTKSSRTTYFDFDGRSLRSYGVQTAFRIFGRVQINRDGPFFNSQSRSTIGGYPAGTLGSRIAQILHELAHMIYKPYAEGGQPLIEDDGGNAGQSGENTDRIMNEGDQMGNCRNAIEAYLKDPRYRHVEEMWAQENR